MELDGIKVQLREISKDLAEIKILLTGNGSPEKGLLVRVDRIEQREVRKSNYFKAWMGAIVTAIVGIAAKVLFKH